MIRKRIIPVLLINDQKLIHRSNFDKNTDIYVGDPINAINIFNQYQVDEMVFIDVSKKNKYDKIDFDLLEVLTSEAFFPTTYGGGIKNLHDAKKIINIGFEKIIVNSMLFDSPSFVSELVNYLGSQSVIASIDIYSEGGEYFLFDHKKQAKTDKKFKNYIDKIILLNPGEILITHVNNDGTMSGYDDRFFNDIVKLTNKPIIYKGGSRNYSDIKSALTNNISALASSTVFIMKKKNGGIVLNYPNYEEKKDIYGNL
jgi:imidazole glycerol-phosphate synthase subunit HisF